jgi:hypothetical protein
MNFLRHKMTVELVDLGLPDWNLKIIHEPRDMGE